jgi:hypothetical protein
MRCEVIPPILSTFVHTFRNTGDVSSESDDFFATKNAPHESDETLPIDFGDFEGAGHKYQGRDTNEYSKSSKSFRMIETQE